MNSIASQGASATRSLPTGSLNAALGRTRQLLALQPELAREQAQEILRAVPGHPIARMLLGAALRQTGEGERALALLEELAAQQPSAPAVHYELALSRVERGQHEAAASSLRRVVKLQPAHAEAWRALGDVCMILGEAAAADAAYAEQIKAGTRDPRLLAAAVALCANDLAQAEVLLRAHLRQYATDVAALRMLAEVAGRLRRYPDAVALLQRCLELSPSFHAARQNLVFVLNRQSRFPEAFEHVEHLLRAEPANPFFLNLRATLLARVGEQGESIRIYGEILAKHPAMPGVWLNYGHTLSAAGRSKDSIAAYRKCIEYDPDCGEAYWSLANLKTFRFEPSDVLRMQERLANSKLKDEERLHFHFALGKSFEDAQGYEESFGHYAAGNRLHRASFQYSADENRALVRRSRELFTPEFFAARKDYGHPAHDPIFVVGLPRAGSTLVEQILSSHSLVEGTMEHPDVLALSVRIGRRGRKAGGREYPEALAELTAAQCEEMGAEYLEHTRLQRKTGKPLFIDKMPNNFQHLALIRLILPNARIIDARRHPMACCFSAFKQHFARGQHFTYSLQEIARYYRDYVELMAHWDQVLPGAVHRVIYEEMVDDTERSVRELLGFCDLPFEESCLRFYENDRAVRTASAQQVRRPIFREGVDQWRHFEPWLAELGEGLGTVAKTYPTVPEEFRV